MWNYKNLTREDLMEYLDDILTVLSELDDKIEIFDFIRDLTTRSEIVEISRRFKAAQMLVDKKSYKKIEEEIHMSSKNIAIVSRNLKWERQWYNKAMKILSKKRK